MLVKGLRQFGLKFLIVVLNQICPNYFHKTKDVFAVSVV